MRPGEDTERDAWLSEALRHAPDAAVGPPPSLSDAILREARSATAAAGASSSARRVGPDAAPRSFAGWLGDAWAWLARPPVAAGFASIVAATLVGMLWWDRPMDDAMPRAPEPVAASPASRSQRQLEAQPADAQPAPAARKDAIDAAAPAAPPPAAIVVPRAADKATAAGKAESETRPPDASSKAQTDATVKKRAEAAPAERPEPRQPEPFPATAGPPAGDRLASANAARASRAAPGAESKTATERAALDAGRADQAEPMRRRAAGPAPAQSATPEPAAAAPAPAGRLREMAKVAASPLGALRGALAAEPQRWSWQLDGQPARPVGPALQRWLDHADAAFADGRPDLALGQAPRDAAAPPSRGEAAAGAADAGVTVRLLRDGREHTTLQVGDDSLQVGGTDTGARRAGVPASVAAALRAELAAAAR